MEGEKASAHLLWWVHPAEFRLYLFIIFFFTPPENFIFSSSSSCGCIYKIKIG